jgi:hypothetical protein
LHSISKHNVINAKFEEPETITLINLHLLVKNFVVIRLFLTYHQKLSSKLKKKNYVMKKKLMPKTTVTRVIMYTSRLIQICVNLKFLIFVLTAILPIIRVPSKAEKVINPIIAWFKNRRNPASIIRPIIAKIPRKIIAESITGK